MTTQLWQELNDRQQKYVLAIYDVDQIQEQDARGAWKRGEPSRPASEWRWMLYATAGMPPRDTALKARLRELDLIDQGTGSTFEALERRKLIECSYDVPPDQVRVKLTTAGRRLARHGLGDERPQRLPPGTLTEWQWQALVELYQASADGLEQPGRRGSYGSASWATWQRLLNYGLPASRLGQHNPRALMFELVDYQPRLIHRAFISDFGRAFYAEQYERYAALYPQIVAAPPQLELPEHQGRPRLAELIRAHRCARGYREAATEAGVSPAALCRAERGGKIDQVTLERICTWLAISPDECADGEGGA